MNDVALIYGLNGSNGLHGSYMVSYRSVSVSVWFSVCLCISIYLSVSHAHLLTHSPSHSLAFWRPNSFQWLETHPPDLTQHRNRDSQRETLMRKGKLNF